MATYVITFEIGDATRKGKIKALLTQQFNLKAITGYCPIHDNAWAVVSEKTATELRSLILPILADTDRLFIIRSGTEAAWKNSYGSDNDAWLKKNL